MKKRIRIIVVLLVIACLFCMPQGQILFATQSQIDEVKENIDQIEAEQKENQQELNELEAKKAYLKGEVAKLNSSLASAAGALTEFESEMAGKELEIEENRQKLLDANAEVYSELELDKIKA